MEEINDTIVSPDEPIIDANIVENASAAGNLPTDTSEGFWSKIKSFFLQEVEEDNFWFKNITIEPAIDKSGKTKSFLFSNITLR